MEKENEAGPGQRHRDNSQPLSLPRERATGAAQSPRWGGPARRPPRALLPALGEAAPHQPPVSAAPGLPGPSKPPRHRPSRPGTPRAPRPVPDPPNRRPQRRGSSAPRPSPPIGCCNVLHAPKGGAYSLPPIRAPRLAPPPARGSALFPPPLPASRTSSRHWIELLSLKTGGSVDWSEVARVGSGGREARAAIGCSEAPPPGQGGEERSLGNGGTRAGAARGP